MILSPSCPVVQLLLASTGKGIRAVGLVRYSLTVFDQVRGIPSLPDAKLSMALLSSSTDGSESNSSMVGRHSITSELRETRCSLWNRSQNSVLPISPSTYIPLMFPVLADVCISWLSCVQYSFAHRLAA